MLASVGQQVANKTFDPSKTEVFEELIECLGDVRGMKRLRTATLLGEEIGTPSTPYLLDALKDHPNVIKLYELFEDKKNFYLVME